MSFNTINIYSNFTPGDKDNSKDFDTLFTFNLTETPGYMITLHEQNLLIKA